MQSPDLALELACKVWAPEAADGSSRRDQIQWRPIRPLEKRLPQRGDRYSLHSAAQENGKLRQRQIQPQPAQTARPLPISPTPGHIDAQSLYPSRLPLSDKSGVG